MAQNFEDSPFGFHPAGIFKSGYLNNGFLDAENIGVRWHRPPVYAFWFIVQPDTSDTTLDFSMYDNKYGSVPPGIHILANIAPENPGFPQGYTLPDSYMPIDEAQYVTFVQATAERYDGDGINDMPGLVNPIKYWQVGNEPSVLIQSDFAELQRITYQAIKSACSDCVVLNGGVAGMGMIGGDDYVTNFNTMYAPIISDLAGQYVDVFDFHWYGNATGDYRLRNPTDGQEVLTHIRATLAEAGFSDDLPIWITEMGTYSGDPASMPFPPFLDLPLQTERQQAGDYLKRHVYSLVSGVKKIFPAFGLIEGFKHDDGYFDHTGLIYDGQDSDDLGLGVKKLGYYTYKIMTEKLEGSDWDTIQTLFDSEESVYAYKFIKTETDEPIYVAWWDWFDDSTYIEGDTTTVTLLVGDMDSMKITCVVPDAESGTDLDEGDYPTFFAMETKQVIDGVVTITLGKNPVFVEVLSSTTSIENENGSLIPKDLYLGQNYPNPFNSQTSIEYQLPLSGRIVLSIYNMLGQEVKMLVDENQSAGYYSVVWNGNDNSGKKMTSGVYLFTIETKDFIQTRKLLLLK